MIILADNDVIHKLACCDLLYEFMVWLKSPPSEIYVLPTLIYKVRRLLKNDSASLARLESFIKNHTKEVPTATIESLSKFSTLDVGEQTLLAVFVENADKAKILTGDKRALRQIAAIASQDPHLHNALLNRVECLELILLGLINQFGFDAINQKVILNSSVDSVLKMAFGRNEQHAIEALNSFISSIKSEVSYLN